MLYRNPHTLICQSMISAAQARQGGRVQGERAGYASLDPSRESASEGGRDTIMRELAHELPSTTRCRVEFLPTSPPLFHKEESCEQEEEHKGGEAENAMQEEEEEE